MITGLYAGIFGILFAKISLDTISARRSQKVALGTGPNNEIAYLVAAHSNFSAYVPLLLILMYFAETSGTHPFILHGLGIVILTGRVLHYLTMKSRESNFKYRKQGMMMTIWPLIILSTLGIWFYLRSIFLN